MTSNTKILVMFANQYEVKDDKTGKVSTGVSVEYYFWGQHGEELDVKVRADNKPAGIRRSKASIDASMINKVSFVPGIYDAELEMTVGSDGKPVLKLLDFDFDSKVVFSAEKAEPAKGSK